MKWANPTKMNTKHGRNGWKEGGGKEVDLMMTGDNGGKSANGQGWMGGGGGGGRGWVGKDETKTQVWDEPIEEVKVEGSQNKNCEV